jgi:hypothetical protein
MMTAVAIMVVAVVVVAFVTLTRPRRLCEGQIHYRSARHHGARRGKEPPYKIPSILHLADPPDTLWSRRSAAGASVLDGAGQHVELFQLCPIRPWYGPPIHLMRYAAVQTPCRQQVLVTFALYGSS